MGAMGEGGGGGGKEFMNDVRNGFAPVYTGRDVMGWGRALW